MDQEEQNISKKPGIDDNRPAENEITGTLTARYRFRIKPNGKCVTAAQIVAAMEDNRWTIQPYYVSVIICDDGYPPNRMAGGRIKIQGSTVELDPDTTAEKKD